MRVTQTTDFLIDAITACAEGRVCPAAFQRPYVWGADDVEALFRSALKGLPLGALALWTPPFGASGLSRGRLGPVEVDPASSPSLVLDGQNRLATFAWAMRGDLAPSAPAVPYSKTERETWLSGRTLVADADERRVKFVPDCESLTRRRVPLGPLLIQDEARRRVLFAAMDLGADADEIDWYDSVVRSVSTARVVVTTVLDAGPEEAREAFLDICRTGVPMSAEDLDRAMAWAAP